MGIGAERRRRGGAFTLVIRVLPAPHDAHECSKASDFSSALNWQKGPMQAQGKVLYRIGPITEKEKCRVLASTLM